jgi:Asp-tRNA(Asn)/Glu-tRNA(Gln) amidotransferase A subunit family amidase
MKRSVILTLLFLAAATTNSFSQNRTDTASVGIALRLIGLNFTGPEIDSMADRVRSNTANYQRMRRIPLSNNVAYPFAFNPAPPGFKMDTLQKKLTWKLDKNIVMPANKADLAFYSIPQLAALLRAKKISSVALTQFFIDRLNKWKDSLHCVISLTEDIALREAAQADADLAKGIYKGPLQGIPYGLKDLFAVKGTRTTWGAAPFQYQMINQDAFIYTRLHNAGAVLCAKLSMGSLAMGDLWFEDRTRNPWNLRTGSSGSSAGSASAVAAGLLPFAIGTETLGSIVSPSATCGTTGLRPSFGSISRSGAMVLSWSLDKAGPICRSAEDAAIVFASAKGTDGLDASAVNPAFNYPAAVNLKKLRIAYPSNYFAGLDKSSPVRAVLDSMQKLGAELREIVFPDSVLYPFAIVDPIINSESAAAFDEFTRSDMDDKLTAQRKNDWPNSFRTSRLIPAVEYINANRHRAILIEKFAAFMKDIDVLIVPSFSGRQLAITNLTGNPVVCMPVGFTERGLPISITFVGKLYDDATVLAVAKAYQDRTPFNKKHPEQFLR